MIRDAILEICGVKEVFELPQVLLTKLLSSEQADLLERIGAIYGDRQLDPLNKTSWKVEIENPVIVWK
ncbi:TPA: hypothetical protein ACGPAQ_000580 [Streptococcus suis]